MKQNKSSGLFVVTVVASFRLDNFFLGNLPHYLLRLLCILNVGFDSSPSSTWVKSTRVMQDVEGKGEERGI